MAKILGLAPLEIRPRASVVLDRAFEDREFFDEVLKVGALYEEELERAGEILKRGGLHYSEPLWSTVRVGVMHRCAEMAGLKIGPGNEEIRRRLVENNRSIDRKTVDVSIRAATCMLAVNRELDRRVRRLVDEIGQLAQERVARQRALLASSNSTMEEFGVPEEEIDALDFGAVVVRMLASTEDYARCKREVLRAAGLGK